MTDQKQKQVNREVERTLEAFKTDVPPKLDPWFYDRLMNRIQNDEDSSQPVFISWFPRVLKPGLLAGLVALNIMIMIWNSGLQQSDSSPRITYIDNLTDEYGLNISDTYLLNSEGEN
ncbi:MAG: hypothetical protein HQ508_00870 [Candidatus Marinimicrobia bacterium]|nr:hypothetical protein [Candidatus Neomarinimicrobiota bacterium]